MYNLMFVNSVLESQARENLVNFSVFLGIIAVLAFVSIVLHIKYERYRKGLLGEFYNKTNNPTPVAGDFFGVFKSYKTWLWVSFAAFLVFAVSTKNLSVLDFMDPTKTESKPLPTWLKTLVN